MNKETEIAFIERETGIIARSAKAAYALSLEIPDMYKMLVMETFISTQADLLVMLDERLKTLRSNK